MPLVNVELFMLLAYLLFGLVIITDMILMPRLMFFKIKAYGKTEMLDKCSEYILKQLKKKRNKTHADSLVAHYILAQTFCRDINEKLNPMIENLVLNRMSAQFIRELLAAAMMLNLRGYEDEAILLYQKIATSVAAISSTDLAVQSALTLCMILLYEQDKKIQAEKLLERISATPEATKRVIPAFRLYQLSGDAAYLEQCLAQCQSEQVRYIFENFDSYKNKETPNE